MFESHITVNMNRNKFKSICKRLNITPICIKDDTGSKLSTQLMTRKFHYHNCVPDVIQEVLDLSSEFTDVVRRKIEVILGKSNNINEIGVPILYYEYHLKYNIPSQHIDEFKKLVDQCGCHTAKNIFKQGVHKHNTRQIRFVTARSESAMNLARDTLSKYPQMGTMMEAVIYDDNPTIDSEWVCDCPLKVIK